MCIHFNTSKYVKGLGLKGESTICHAKLVRDYIITLDFSHIHEKHD